MWHLIKKKIFAEDSLAFASFIIAFFYLFSAILGLFRNRILAGYFGDSVELGIFYMADKLPSLIFSVLILTVTSSAFIPVYSEYKKKNITNANNFMSNIMTVSLVVYLLISTLIFIFSEFFANLVSWYSLDRNALSLLASLLRFMLLAQIGLIITTFFSIFLQSNKRFLISALVPITYNLGVVVGTVLFFDEYGIYAPALGMILGSIISVFIQLPVLKNIKYSYKFVCNFTDIGVKKVLKLITPKFFGISVYRLYTLTIGGMISFIYGSPSFLVVYEFANQLQTMPINAFGASLSQAVFPTISDYAAEKKHKQIANLTRSYIVKIIYFTLPVSALFIILKIPLVRLLFGGDSFSWLGTNLTAYTLAFFSISIVFQTLSTFFTKIYYSLQNSRTPNFVSALTLLLSLVLAGIFSEIMNMGVWSFALAFSIGSLFNTILLYVYLIPTLGNFLLLSAQDFVKISYASLLSSVFTYILMKFLEEVIFDTTRTVPLFVLTFIITLVGGSIYIFVADLLGVSIFKDLLHKARKSLNLG